MMRLCCLCAIIFFSVVARAQDTAVVKRLANRFAKATFNGDAKTVLDFSYPALIKLSGGREAMEKMITERIAELKGRGVMKFDGWVNSPGPFYTAGNQIHVLFPETVVMRMINGRYISHSYLLGISEDNGKSWTFMDVGNMPANVLQRLLPQTDPAMKIPPPTQPSFFPDQSQ
ncbi:hypothetical protein D0C36_16635 [Mucilaginibacter conchicola]|uniref:DUF4019 domain-containing protein n=1 Tax=Mucilaginibacter conchicola TaxID=2303333 RepID=A0A372NQE5_9SPHI|nr:hypothetical protein [Mucilaginibacter conchicola]RFZ90595.1 hypothetical protein D0C36_16635 [Mucilaginibacter conchicola]